MLEGGYDAICDNFDEEEEVEGLDPSEDEEEDEDIDGEEDDEASEVGITPYDIFEILKQRTHHFVHRILKSIYDNSDEFVLEYSNFVSNLKYLR